MIIKHPERVWVKTEQGWYSREATEYDKALRDETTARLFGRILARARKRRANRGTDDNDHL